MDSTSHNLGSLLHPWSIDEFFADSWERKPLFIQRRDRDYYRDLLTDRDLEDIISNSDLRYPAIQLAKNGTFYPAAAYTSDVRVGQLVLKGVPNVGTISAEYGRGSTIVLPALLRTWEPLRMLAWRLETELDFSIHANAYITPGQAAGFPAHYDTHDVFVLQIAGQKRWRVTAPPIRLPHKSQTFKPEGFTPGPLIAEYELEAGDLLYLPRGYVHATTTSDSHSAHVTMGVNIFTWADLVGELVPSSALNEQFRQSLPPGFASRAELRPSITRQLSKLLDSVGVHPAFDADRYFEQLRRDAMAASWARNPVRFRADAIALSWDSRLHAPSEERYTLARNGEEVTLVFEGRQYLFAARFWPALSMMCSRPAFSLKEFNGGLDGQTLLGFAGFLQSVGFLRGLPRLPDGRHD
jgi:ribosomal protein L16 Arg81 hydroxylase